MTRYEFIKNILKEGNIVLRVDFSNSDLHVYKLAKACGTNNSWIKGTLTYYRGEVYGGLVCLDINRTSEENITFSEYYVVKEEY